MPTPGLLNRIEAELQDFVPGVVVIPEETRKSGSEKRVISNPRRPKYADQRGQSRRHVRKLVVSESHGDDGIRVANRRARRCVERTKRDGARTGYRRLADIPRPDLVRRHRT